MAQTIEVDLGAILERIETNLNNHIVATQKDLTDIKVTLARLEGKVEILQVEADNAKEEIKEIKNDIKGRISIQTYWFLLLISLLVGVVGKLAFFPNV